MTCTAIRQFIALCGGEQLAKGSRAANPQAIYPSEAYLMGQDDYIAGHVRAGGLCLICPFAPGTVEAEQWARGKLFERLCERAVVEAYRLEDERRSA